MLPLILSDITDICLFLNSDTALCVYLCLNHIQIYMTEVKELLTISLCLYDVYVSIYWLSIFDYK